MAINKITGNILQDNLIRGANLAIQGNLIYFDVTGSNVGIYTSTPEYRLDVNGTFRTTGNATLANISTGGVITATGNITGGNLISNNNVSATNMFSSNVSITNLTTTGNLKATVSANLGNLNIANTTISSNLAVGNINLVPTGNSTVIIDANTGLTIAVGNTSQRPTPALQGTVRFNTDSGYLEIYDGAGWDSIAPTGTLTITNQTITPDGTSTNYTLNQSSTSASILVTINGVNQTPDTDYTVSGTTITFTDTPLTTDIIQVRFLSAVSSTDYITNSSGNARVQATSTGNVTLQAISSGYVNVTGNILPSANGTYDLGASSARWNNLWLTGSTLILGNIVMKNTTANTIGFFGPDGTTPATLDANANIVSDSIASGTSSVGFASGNGNILLVAGGNTTGTITSTGANITGTLNASGNANVGNLGTSGLIVATGNITGGNLRTASVTIGNGPISGVTTISASGNANVGNIGAVAAVFTGNANVGNLGTSGLIVATGNITGGNLITSGLASIGTTLSVTGNANVGNIGTSGIITATGNITGGNLSTAGRVTATGNITGGNLSVSTGSVTLGSIINANANGAGNIGSSGGYFNTIFATATSARYADLAEKFSSDAEYKPGTVVVFGGSKQVTTTSTYADTRAAGVVSTNPAHLMNAALDGISINLALAGQIPCFVIGPVNKGDVLTTSNVPGYACKLESKDWNPGCTIGKALEDCGPGQHTILIISRI